MDTTLDTITDDIIDLVYDYLDDNPLRGENRLKIQNDIKDELRNARALILDNDNNNLKVNNMMQTIGRVVIYNTTKEDQVTMGVLGCNIQEQLPAIIVKVWGDTEDSCVNLKVIQDGPSADLWKNSINKGDEAGNWNWPVKV